MAARKSKSDKELAEFEEKEQQDIEDKVVMMTEEMLSEATIEDLPGVGPATAEKLREAGFEELLAVAVMSPSDLADQAELGEAVASKIINAAKKMANIGGFVSGSALLERRRELSRIWVFMGTSYRPTKRKQCLLMGSKKTKL